MCGRYRLSRRKQLVEEYFDSVSDEPDWTPRFNIAPTQPIPVIRQHPKEPVRELSVVRWVRFPQWSKDSSHHHCYDTIEELPLHVEKSCVAHRINVRRQTPSTSRL